MQRIISREIKNTIDIAKLQNVVPPFCKVIKYDRLRGNNLKDIMGKYTVLIVLWNIHDQAKRILDLPGHFFVISTRGPEKCVVFSSTGMSPKKELFITHSDPTLFDRVLPKGTVYNTKKLQLNTSSNTCWRWCIVFAHFAPMGLKAFQHLFSRPVVHLTTSDQLVTALTLMSLY